MSTATALSIELTSNRGRKWHYLIALALVSFVSRLPQLLSPNLLLDGDECTLGLMAKHLAQGKEFPTFFYGQHYGLSTVEAAAGALSFLIFGTGAIPLKLAMLALWTLGILFLFLALSRLLGYARSFWIVLVLLLNPAWAVWSMKARGGYVTAFTATGALLWLLMQELESTSVMRELLAGLLTSVIYLAQPLWLPGVLPIAMAVLLSRRQLSPTISYLSVATATGLLVRTWGRQTIGNPNLWLSLPALAHQIYLNLSGAYYLWWDVEPPGPATKLLAGLWCSLLLAAALAQLARLFTKRFYLPSHLLFLALGSTLVAEWLLLEDRDGRYLLPLSALLVLLVGVELVELVD